MQLLTNKKTGRSLSLGLWLSIGLSAPVSAQTMPDLSGEWICQNACPAGGIGKTARILQTGRNLFFTNEGGATSKGVLQSDLKTVVASDWEGGLKATIATDAKSLRWTNGTVWSRAFSKVLSATGKVDVYGIHFDVDKADIRPDSKAALDEVAGVLNQDRTLRLEVSGHTDNSGSAAHNIQLSQRRAGAVVAKLVRDYGIDRARLTAKGYGDTKPVASNGTVQGKAENRRVELRKL